MRIWFQTICLGGLLLLGSPGLHGESAARPDPALDVSADDDLFTHATCIVMGRLSNNVHQDSAGERSALIEQPHPLLMRIMPSEVWPGNHPDDSVNLHFTSDDTFKPGDDGIWVLQMTDQGFVAKGVGSFRPAGEKEAFLTALDKWLRAQVQSKMKEALAAIKADPDGDQEATWKTVRQLAVLFECELASPLYSAKPRENPMRSQLTAFYAALGLKLPVAANPKTPEEIKLATPQLKHFLYVSDILDHPEDPKYHDAFERCLDDYWTFSLNRLNSTLAATPVEFAGEVAMRKHLDTAEVAAQQFPPAAKVTRMLLFWGGPKQ